MKRSLFTRCLRLEMMDLPLLLGLAGVAVLVRAVTYDSRSVFYPAVASISIVIAAALIFHAIRKN